MPISNTLSVNCIRTHWVRIYMCRQILFIAGIILNKRKRKIKGHYNERTSSFLSNHFENVIYGILNMSSECTIYLFYFFNLKTKVR